jgi:Tol biopolymer transport system component
MKSAALVAAAAVAAGTAFGRPPPGGSSSTPPSIVYDNVGSIFVMNADGKNARRVLDGAGQGVFLLEPAFSPDGSTIAFIGGPFGAASLGLYTVKPDGTALTLVTPTTDGYAACAWSPAPAPDGRHKIAYTDMVGGSPEIILINPDGTGKTQLTLTGAAAEWRLSWSPDATRIAVTHRFGGSENDCLIYDLGLDAGGSVVATGLTNLTDVPGSPLAGRSLGEIQSCDWSRGGGKIAIVARGVETHDLWIVDVANPASVVNITAAIDGNQDGYPTWSPDDSKLMFWRGGTGPLTGLCTINANGTGVKKISASGNRPDWKRVP